MKSSSLLTLCGAAAMALLPLASISAQTPPPAGKTGTEVKPPRHPMPNIQERLDRMKQDLGLSDDQVAKLKEVFETQKAAIEPIAKDKTLSREQKREKMKPIMEETKTKVNAVLTPEQQTKLEAIRKERQTKSEKKSE